MDGTTVREGNFEYLGGKVSPSGELCPAATFVGRGQGRCAMRVNDTDMVKKAVLRRPVMRCESVAGDV